MKLLDSFIFWGHDLSHIFPLSDYNISKTFLGQLPKENPGGALVSLAVLGG